MEQMAHAVLYSEAMNKRKGLSDLPKKWNQSALRCALYGQIAILAVFGGPLACTPVKDEAPATVFRLPWPNGSGDYSLQSIRLETFSEPDKFRGSVGTILIDPRLEGGRVVSDEPNGRWIQEGDVQSAGDFVTLQAGTLYAHLEKLDFIDRELGLGKLIKGPSRVGLLARVTETATSTNLILNNALYDGFLDTLFVVPFVGSRLPISINAGIIAHEHFHRIFQNLILNPIRQSGRHGGEESDGPMGACSWGFQAQHAGAVAGLNSVGTTAAGNTSDPVALKVYNQVLVRGLNEGLADFWGWSYAQDSNFVARSLGDSEDGLRRLDKSTPPLLKTEMIKSNLFGKRSEVLRVMLSYRIGTYYARMLYGLVDALTKSGADREGAIVTVRTALVPALNSLSMEVVSAWGKTELDPEAIVRPLIQAMTNAKISVRSSSLSDLSPAQRKALCVEFKRLEISQAAREPLCGKDLEVNVESETPTGSSTLVEALK